ncbi:MAG TPA: DUF1634 domain-containing protein [Oscillatoriaceae cyanobacterium]
MSLEPQNPEEAYYRKLEARVANFLWVGTIVSAVLIAGGLALSFFEGPHAKNLSPVSPHDIWFGLRAMHPVAYETLGIIVLLALPVVRVAIGSVGFFRRREVQLGAIALAVLGVMVVSFALGAAHHG